MYEDKTKSNFPVIGIGASAGGLDALEGFFSKIPDDLDIAFVVIQHLNPDHDSMMGSLLKKFTSMHIQVIEEGQELKSGTLYLNPPNKNVALVNGTFHLSEINVDNKSFFRIDYFFRSLAKDLGRNAICIVLSGTGSDGSIGLREVKSAGGMTMVQEGNQAEYEGMPQSAIDTGLVDVITSTDAMSEELIQYIRHPYMGTSDLLDINLRKHQDTLNEIFNLLKKRTGQDFSNYKLNTIYRRIERRMAVHRIEKLDAYLQYLKQHESEIYLLFQELLITVTSFFRDEATFEKLREKVIPELLKQLPTNKPLRIWVPGCATGEEAYSIAMVLIEVMEAQDKMVDCKIFASDIDKNSIETARQGLYPKSITADVGQERLHKFFKEEDHQYRVKKRLRDIVVFAEQNLNKDPPFSKIDLISCRNVLIYMNQEMHKKLFPVFYYALNNDGILLLGSSESISGFEKAFKPLDNHINIFQKQNGVLENVIDYPPIPQSGGNPKSYEPPKDRPVKQTEVQDMVEQTILDCYTHPSVIVNANYDILFLYGQTEIYLSLPKGKASLNLLNVAEKSIQYKLLATLKEALEKKETVKESKMKLWCDHGYYTFDLIVHPIRKPVDGQQLLLVVFKDNSLKSIPDKQETEDQSASKDDQRIKVMEQELQSTIEQLEISNEELQSKNEELQATNEELQSSIEELETSKEEAQSTNEELISVNAELKQKINDLAEANNDINNLLASTEIATIFLDQQLCIKRYTPDMSKIFNLIQSDIGRPISDITSNINYANIYEDAKHVLETLEKQEKEIQTEAGDWYAVNLIPYRTMENIINGIVITFVDITENKLSKEANRLAAVVRDSNDVITTMDLKGNITTWNRSAEIIYGYTQSEALKMNIQELLPQGKKNQILDFISQINLSEATHSIESQRITKSGQIIDIWLTITPLLDNTGKTYALATTEKQLKDGQLKYQDSSSKESN